MYKLEFSGHSHGDGKFVFFSLFFSLKKSKIPKIKFNFVGESER